MDKLTTKKGDVVYRASLADRQGFYIGADSPGAIRVAVRAFRVLGVGESYVTLDEPHRPKVYGTTFNERYHKVRVPTFYVEGCGREFGRGEAAYRYFHKPADARRALVERYTEESQEAEDTAHRYRRALRLAKAAAKKGGR